MSTSRGEAPAGHEFRTHWPLAESPFLERILAARTDLGEPEREQIRSFARDGYCVLERAASDELIERVQSEVRPLFRPDVSEGPASYYRKQDAWETSSAAREMALLPEVLALLRRLYGREPLPFQTLDFLYGTQQYPHSDAILFNTLPARFMCGVWVALEDIDHDNGPLFYYPGSHRLPQYYPDDWNVDREDPDVFIGFTYPRLTQPLMEAHGLERREFHARKGDALVWASNLVHGGMPRLDTRRTRWSQVTHYFFEECVCYVPLYSRPVAGEFHLREVRDFRSGAPVAQSYNGVRFRAEPAGGGRSRIVLEEPLAPASEIQELRRLAADDPAAGAARDPSSPAATRGFLDEFVENDEAATLAGWALRDDSGSAESVQAEILLAGADAVWAAIARRLERPDVAKLLGDRFAGSGFRVTLDKEGLSPGAYRVGALLRAPGRAPLVFWLGREITVRST